MGQEVQAPEFIRWQFSEGMGDKCIELLTPKFQSVEILEHYGQSWKLRMSRDYSIGYLFGLMEDIKGEYQISEYSVT